MIHKHAQITVFIILGIMILFITSLALYAYNQITVKRMELERLPPAPPPPGGESEYGRATHGIEITGQLPSWAQPLSTEVELSKKVYYQNEDVAVIIEKSAGDLAVWGTLYYLKDDFWNEVKARKQRKLEKGWSLGDETIFVYPAQKTGTQYFLVYLCKKEQNTPWQCGKWQLGAYEVLPVPIVSPKEVLREEKETVPPKEIVKKEEIAVTPPTQITADCVNNDHACWWECNDWHKDNDCGVPAVYDFTESRSPSEYVQSNTINYDDTAWRNYAPLLSKVAELIAGLTDDFEKAKKIGTWVRNSRPYQLNGVSVANKAGSVIDVFNEPEGVCLDSGILMTAMLRIAGIPARAVIPGAGVSHQQVHAFINGKWVGFDPTYVCGTASDPNCSSGTEVLVFDPSTQLSYDNEYVGQDAKRGFQFQNSERGEYTDVSYYRVKIIPPRLIDQYAKATFSLQLKTTAPLQFKACQLSGPAGSQSYDISATIPVELFARDSYQYVCSVSLQSAPAILHTSTKRISLMPDGLKIITEATDPLLEVNVQVIEDRETPIELGTVYLPITNVNVFRNTDGTFTTSYDKSQFAEWGHFLWALKADNFVCPEYHVCLPKSSTGFTTHVAPPGMLGYGTLTLYGTSSKNSIINLNKGFAKFQLPAGRYRILYAGLQQEVGQAIVIVNPNQITIVRSSDVTKMPQSNQQLYNILLASLTDAVQTLAVP